MNAHSPLPMQNALPASADRLYDMLLNVEQRLRRLENALMPSPLAAPSIMEQALRRSVKVLPDPHPPAPQWRPISEASRTDERFLLGAHWDCTIPYVMAWDFRAKDWVTYTGDPMPWAPTHWMPLPEPPKAAP
jgi:hypothetical protein